MEMVSKFTDCFFNIAGMKKSTYNGNICKGEL